MILRFLILSLFFLTSCAHQTVRPADLQWPVNAGAPIVLHQPPEAPRKVELIRVSTPIDVRAAAILSVLLEASRADHTIVVLSSPGGDLLSAATMALAIMKHPRPVVCVVDRLAASGAMLVLQVCPLRYMTPGSYLMLHPPTQKRNSVLDSVEDLLEFGDVHETVEFGYCFRLHMNLEKCHERYRGSEWWLDPDEAVRVGAADGIVKSAEWLAEFLAYPPDTPLKDLFLTYP